MQIVQLEEAQANLADLIQNLSSGQEVLIAKGDLPLATLVRAEPASHTPQFGSARGKVIFHAGWDEPCPGFEEYQ